MRQRQQLIGHDAKRSRRSLAWAKTAAIRAAVFAGAVLGALNGRLVMRLVFLIDESTEGVRTDSGATVGGFTLGGTMEPVTVTAVAGANGRLMYVGLRRLPRSGAARGVAFGMLMAFGPGHLLAETDLQIFEPAVPVYAMFVA